MKTIGMLGGMSWQSTKTYYDNLNKLVGAKLGGLNSADILLKSVNFEPYEQWLSQGAWDTIESHLSADARSLEQAGADCLILCTNTMHKVFSQIEAQLSIPFFHIADCLGHRLTEDGIQKIGLLGTRFTMTEPFYAERLKSRFDIETLIPDEEGVTEVDRVVFSELCVGQVKDESRAQYLNIMQDLADRGAQAIVLACTEIEMLVKPEDFFLPLYDTTQIHTEFAVNWALNDH